MKRPTVRTLACILLVVSTFAGITYAFAGWQYAAATSQKLARLEKEARPLADARSDVVFSTTLSFLDRKVHDDFLAPPWFEEMQTHRHNIDAVRAKWLYSPADLKVIKAVRAWADRRSAKVIADSNKVRRAHLVRN